VKRDAVRAANIGAAERGNPFGMVIVALQPAFRGRDSNGI
jgi:hypothetical protein